MSTQEEITITQREATARADVLFREHQQRTYVRTDRLIASLMVLQWLSGIVTALWISPNTWSGSVSHTHPHVWFAVLVGGVITFYPVVLAWKRPGEVLTRHCIAAGQLLMSALLIHLMGGRIETHFHVFGSLAFLAFYRDWRVLLTATLVTAIDHLIRGLFLPQSVYGLTYIQPWRWLEHAGWVVFEVVFLVISCHYGLRETRALCERDATLEFNNRVLEQQVEVRTHALGQANAGLHEQIKVREQAEEELRRTAERLAEAQHIAHLGSYEYVLATGEVRWSEEIYHLFDRDPSLGPPAHDALMACYHPEDKQRLLSARQQAFQDRQPYELDIRIRQKDGAYRWRRSIAKPVFDENGNPVRLVGTVIDIHERKQTEEALHQSEAGLVEAQSIAKIGSWEYDISSGTIFWSDEMFCLLEFDRSHGAPSYDSLMTRYHPDDISMHNAFVQKAITTGESYAFDIRAILNDGSLRWFHAIGKARLGADGRPIRLFGTLRDITETRQYEQQLQHANEQLERQIATAREQAVRLKLQKEELEAANERLEALATTDGLTGLKNHRTFQEQLAQEFERSRRYNIALSVILLDVDRFKAYNDAFGHPAGDAVLKSVAHILQVEARNSDLVARYGGEEFVILLTETNAEGARLAAERYRVAIEAATWPERTVTASFGLATLTPVTPDPSALISEADRALYRSKHFGRNCVTHAADPAQPGELPDVDMNMYSALMKSLLESQKDTLVSASESIKEALISAHEETVKSWARILDLRDKESEGHSERVTDMTVRLAQRIGLNEDEVRFARWGALLHDIGKIGVPDHILLKHGALTEEEWALMRRHVDIALEMLSPIEFLKPALDIPYCHHEKWDGAGYPQGLKGEEIPLAARLFAIVDVWDALSSDLPYRMAWARADIRAYLLEQSGKHFDPNAVRIFLQEEAAILEERTQDEAVSGNLLLPS